MSDKVAPQKNSQDEIAIQNQKIKKESVSLEKLVDKLARYGGFDLLETSIENVQNINPERKARRKIFLTEKNKQKDRETLAKTLELWANVISHSDSIVDMVSHCEEQREGVEKLLTKNLSKSSRQYP